MAGVGLDSPHRKINRDRYRRIQLGIRGRSRPGLDRTPSYGKSILFMLIICALSLTGIKYANAKATYAVVVDGTCIGVTDDREICDRIVTELSESEAGLVGAGVALSNTIAYEPNKDKDAKVLTTDEMAEALRRSVSFKAKGYAITVNEQPIVAVATEEEARGVVSDLRAVYIAAIMSSANATVEDVFIREQVGIEECEVTSDMFRTREEAVLVLSRGTDKILNYTVRRGDSVWAIASANKMSVDDLLKANPEVGNGNLIREGQSLNLVVPDPYVTFESKEVITYTVAIPYVVEVTNNADLWPWQETVVQAGRSGQKEICQQITRENGKEVSRVTLSEKVLSHPVTKKISRGSKQVPAMGSGEMAWPCQGSITSNYGWRWGKFHQGIDIGASRGTQIIAADSGMVSYAGWSGGYGYLVKIDHGGGKVTWYGHQSKMAVKTGDTVAKGDVIGYVGSTGVSTGPHLHFEVHQGSSTKNPLSFYK